MGDCASLAAVYQSVPFYRAYLVRLRHLLHDCSVISAPPCRWLAARLTACPRFLILRAAPRTDTPQEFHAHGFPSTFLTPRSNCTIHLAHLTIMYLSLLFLTYLSQLAFSQPLVIQHSQPYSLEPPPSSIADHHILVDHNPSYPPPSSTFHIADSCLRNIRDLCQHMASPSHAEDQWVWVASDGCQVGYWAPSGCGKPWSQSDCEDAGANMMRQLQQGISFVPEINRASINLNEYPIPKAYWDTREAPHDKLASMMIQI